MFASFQLITVEAPGKGGCPIRYHMASASVQDSGHEIWPTASRTCLTWATRPAIEKHSRSCRQTSACLWFLAFRRRTVARIRALTTVSTCQEEREILLLVWRLALVGDLPFPLDATFQSAFDSREFGMRPATRVISIQQQRRSGSKLQLSSRPRKLVRTHQQWQRAIQTAGATKSSWPHESSGA